MLTLKKKRILAFRAVIEGWGLGISMSMRKIEPKTILAVETTNQVHLLGNFKFYWQPCFLPSGWKLNISSVTFYNSLQKFQVNSLKLPFTGCKESRLYSLPFGQVVASMY